MELTAELVPSTVWYSSLYRLLPREVWNSIREGIIADKGRVCEICGEVNGKMNLHEIWNYDDAKHIQRLDGFILLCEMCHHVKHIGLTRILASKGKLDYDDVIGHFCKVNNCSKRDFEKHEKDAFEAWSKRSKHQWKQDFGKYKEFIKTMKKFFDGYWIWLLSEEKPNYAITGKYLFFCEDKDKLIEIANSEIENHGFHRAKVNENLLEGQTEHVLCLYYMDDSRKQELAERNKQKYEVKYRYWKSDEATLKGQYSSEFLNKLPKSERNHFTREKEIVEFKNQKGNVILRQVRPKDGRKKKSKN